MILPPALANFSHHPHVRSSTDDDSAHILCNLGNSMDGPPSYICMLFINLAPNQYENRLIALQLQFRDSLRQIRTNFRENAKCLPVWKINRFSTHCYLTPGFHFFGSLRFAVKGAGSGQLLRSASFTRQAVPK